MYVNAELCGTTVEPATVLTTTQSGHALLQLRRITTYLGSPMDLMQQLSRLTTTMVRMLDDEVHLTVHGSDGRAPRSRISCLAVSSAR